MVLTEASLPAQTVGPDHCFLCGESIPPGSSDRTREHVFPRWLLSHLGLYDRGVTSIDGRIVHYRRLVVPCCTGCNSGELARLEERVQKAVEAGPHGFLELDRRDAFLWLGKVYYGLLYFESLLAGNPRDPDGPRVVPAEQLRALRFHHFLLGAARGEVRWEPETPGPASILTFECLPGATAAQQFDYCDDLQLPVLALRVGELGIVAALQDWGAVESIVEKRLVAGKHLALHPTQFREIFAMVRYLTHTTWTDRVHLAVTDPASGTTTLIEGPQSARPTEGIVEPAEYAAFLAKALETSIDDVFDGEHVIMLTCDGNDAPNPVSPDTAFCGLSGGLLWPHRGEVL